MRLTKIQIIHFGKINEISYDLKPDLDVFFGVNEAGKSTTVAFIKQIIFGFHLKNNKSAFFEDYFPLSKASPMGGRLYFEDKGQEFILQRTYASGDSKKGSLKIWLDGQEVPETTFFDKIKNIDGDFYTDSFIFNQEMLTQVTSLNQNELMERIYFLGAAQSNKLLKLRKGYTDSASNLFKKTGRKPVINQLLTKIDNQKKRVEQTNQQFDSYQEFLLQTKDLEDNLKDAQSELEKLNKENQKLLLIKEKVKNFDEYQQLKKQTKEIVFSKPLYDQAQALSLEIKNLTNSLNSKQEYLNELQKQSNPTQVSQMQDLVDQKAELLQWQNEVNQLQKNNQQLKEEIAQTETINPDILKIQNLDATQIADLKSEFQSLQDKDNSSDKSYLVSACWIIAVVGAILAFISKNFVWLVLTIVGVIGGFWFNQSKKQPQDQKKEFQQKYGINPDVFNLDNTLSLLYQLQAKQKSLTQNQTEINELASQIQNFELKLKQILGSKYDDQESISANLKNLAQIVNDQLQLSSQINQLKQELDRIGPELKLQQQTLALIYTKAQVKNQVEFDDRKAQAADQERLKLQIETILNNLGDDLSKIQALEKSDNSVDKKLAELDEKIANCQARITNVQEQLAEVRIKQNNLADSNDVFNEKQNLASLQSQLKDQILEYLSDLSVSNWIARSLDLASNERFPKMLSSAKEYFKLLTGGRYIDLKLDKKLVVIDSNHKKKEVQFLSRGTSEQLYFALKLSFVEQISDEISLPILIDDAFVNFDQQRTDYIVQLIEKLSQKMQVLIFTHRKELADEFNSNVISLTSEVK
ncbi:AAA family ATPase [uncultured Lactobacillus sp.]|uniref:ATP-binding protein n=1 Tax=uncultured Lactobacillus sp. TaxID=153152 RepID=UPI0026034D24|nr:AAA family ATPase [uncultured Lactobacillus sp.]